MEKKEIGKVTNFFAKISVGAIKLTDTLMVGDTISVEGPHGSFEQKVESMQIDRQEISQARPGDDVGIKLKEKAHAGDKVFVVKD